MDSNWFFYIYIETFLYILIICILFSYQIQTNMIYHLSYPKIKSSAIPIQRTSIGRYKSIICLLHTSANVPLLSFTALSSFTLPSGILSTRPSHWDLLFLIFANIFMGFFNFFLAYLKLKNSFWPISDFVSLCASGVN